MPDFEDLRILDLLQKFKASIEEIARTRSLKNFKNASRYLQDVYNFYLTSQKTYAKEEQFFKSLFSSFNYAAVIINNALKNGGLTADDNELLSECIQIMLKCCQSLQSSITEAK